MTQEQFSQWYYNLPILAYGELDNAELLDNLHTILTWKRDGVFISDKIPDNTFTVLEYWLMLGLLSDCIEYGTSPRGAWLNDKGKELLQFLTDGKHIEYLAQQGHY